MSKSGQTHSFVGNYNLLAKLARGDIGDLYLARREGAGGFEKLAVIKRIHQQLTGDKALVDIFVDETRGSASVDHPNVRQVYEFGRYGQHFFIALEYLIGVPFIKLLLGRSQNQKLASPRLIATIFSQVCEGLYAAHSQHRPDGSPLIHGNINPRGIFITANGNAKILDLDIVDMRSVLATRYGFVKRTFAYMSPEEAGSGGLLPSSDIFSLGVVAWESLTGRRLFKHSSEADSRHAILNDVIPEACQVNPKISRQLSDVIKRALQREPGQRFEHARAFGQAFRSAALEEGPPLTSLSIASLIKSAFEKEIAAQELFVRRARARSEGDTNFDDADEYTRVDSQPAINAMDNAQWSTQTHAERSKALADELANLDENYVEPDEKDPFDELNVQFEDAMPEVLEWQDSSSIVKPAHLQELQAADTTTSPPPLHLPGLGQTQADDQVPEWDEDRTKLAKSPVASRASQPAPKKVLTPPPPPLASAYSPGAASQPATPNQKRTVNEVKNPKATSQRPNNNLLWIALGTLGVIMAFLLWHFIGSGSQPPPESVPSKDVHRTKPTLQEVPTKTTVTETHSEENIPKMQLKSPDVESMVFEIQGDDIEDQPKTQEIEEEPAPQPNKKVTKNKGTLTLRATPRAAVYIRRKKLGTTPLVRKELKAGQYRLRLLSSKRKKNKIIKIRIRQNKETKRTIKW